MTRTPWGHASTLRQRRLPPGPATPPREVERNQRERLFAATVATMREKGYAQTTVADITKLSGVSRSSFYQQFADKEDCFLATLDEILGAAQAIAAARMRQNGSLEERARSALETIFELIVEQPAAACLCLVEANAAGPEALAHVDRAMKGFEQLLRASAEERADSKPMPAEMARAMLGGLRKVVHTRLHRGTEADLPGLLPDLLSLGLSYRAPERLRRVSRRQDSAGAPDGRRPVALEADPGARIAAATMSVVAAKGYGATTMADIAEAAGVSLSTLYAHYEGKAEAFDAALYDGRARLLGMTLPAYRRARGWPEGVRAVTETTLAFMESEPEFTRLITVDVYAAGPRALERRDLAIEGGQRVLDEGAERYAPHLKPIARETIIAILYSLVCHRVQDGRIDRLREMAPLATYMALAPFVGPEEACTVANGGHSTAEPLAGERR